MLLSKKLGRTPGHLRANGLGTETRAEWPMPKHSWKSCAFLARSLDGDIAGS